MSNFLHSMRTWSYWQYALFSRDAIKTFLSVLGGCWLLINFSKYFGYVAPDNPICFWVIIAVSIVLVIYSRRPISKISLKVPKKDITVDVKIGDLFDIQGERVISTNTTFDTDISSGLISIESLQGKFTQKYFPENIPELDRQIASSLTNELYEEATKIKGKKKKYPLGTVAKIKLANDNFYLFAMANLNDHCTTIPCDIENLKIALNKLWQFMAERGSVGDIIIPLIGTGRGRIPESRKKVIGLIAESFIQASNDKTFSNKLIIVIHPKDKKAHNINLFEIQDYLSYIVLH